MDNLGENVSLCYHVVPLVFLHNNLLLHHFHGINRMSLMMLYLENLPKSPLPNNAEKLKILWPNPPSIIGSSIT